MGSPAGGSPTVEQYSTLAKFFYPIVFAECWAIGIANLGTVTSLFSPKAKQQDRHWDLPGADLYRPKEGNITTAEAALGADTKPADADNASLASASVSPSAVRRSTSLSPAISQGASPSHTRGRGSASHQRPVSKHRSRAHALTLCCDVSPRLL